MRFPLRRRVFPRAQARSFMGSVSGPSGDRYSLRSIRRFKASVFVEGGLSPWIPLPKVDAVNYLPRNHVPTLLVGGHDDYIVPVESNQKPLLRLLGTPAKDKRQVILDSGQHPANFQDVARQVLPWLDHYLGPVQTRTIQGAFALDHTELQSLRQQRLPLQRTYKGVVQLLPSPNHLPAQLQ